MTQTNDYYADGAIASSYSKENSTVNKLKYQSKEFQDDLGINLYNFHRRQYDPWTQVTTTIDPHSDRYFNYSRYSFVLDNPVSFTDATGKDVQFDITRNKKGRLLV